MLGLDRLSVSLRLNIQVTKEFTKPNYTRKKSDYVSHTCFSYADVLIFPPMLNSMFSSKFNSLCIRVDKLVLLVTWCYQYYFKYDHLDITI